MVALLSNFVMRLRLKEQLKRLSSQSREKQIEFQSLLIVCAEKHANNEELFLKFAQQLSIAPEKITVIVLTTKELMETGTTSVTTHYFSRKSVGVFGKLPSSLKEMFGKKFDLQLNFFNTTSVFTEWVSASFNSDLRVGFSKSNQQLNDLILDINPQEHDVFLRESHTYLKAILK